MFVLLLATFLLTVSADGATDFFGPNDVKAVGELITTERGSSKTFESIRDARFAVSAATDLGIEIENKKELCSFAKETLKSKNLKLSNAFHAVVVTVRLECAEKPSKELQNMLADGLGSSKLSELYAALETRHALRTAGLVSDDAAGRSKGVQALATLSAGDGTYRTSSSSKAAGAAFNAGLVLEAVANSGTKSEQSAVLQRLAALLSRAKQHDSALLFLDAPSESDDSLANLRATAAVVTALARFIDAGVALDALTDDQLSGFAAYLTSIKRVNSLAAAASLARGLRALSDLKSRRPIAIKLTESRRALHSKTPLVISVTDVLGKSVGKSSVKVVLNDSDGNEALGETSGSAASGGAAYEVTLPSSGLACDRYTASIGVTPGSGLVASSVSVPLTLTCTAVVSNAQLSVLAASTNGKGAETDSFALTLGKALDIPLKLASKQALRLSLELQDSASKQAFAAQQVFLRLSHADSGRDAVVAAVKDASDSFVAQFHLNTRTIVQQLGRQSGTWKAEVLIGDTRLSKPVQWHVADVQLAFKGSARPPLGARAARALPTIDHQFREPERRPLSVVSLLFTALSVAPLLLLLVGISRVGFNLSGLTGKVSTTALPFHATLGAILLLYVFYWLQLNMLQTLSYLLVLVPILFLTGRWTLAALVKQRKSRQ